MMKNQNQEEEGEGEGEGEGGEYSENNYALS